MNLDNKIEEEQMFEDVELDDLRQRVSDYGIDVYDPRRQEAIKHRRIAAIRGSRNNKANETATRFLGFKERVAELTGSIVLLLVLYAGYLLPPVGVVGLWVVEIQRVHTGVTNWNAPSIFLWIMSVVIVSIYISMLSIRAREASNSHEHEYAWSLGLYWNRLGYWLGFGKNWKPIPKTELDKVDHAIQWLGRLIILLGTIGAMHGNLAVYDGWWVYGIKQIVTKSELIPFFELVGGIATTWILLKSLHFVINITHSQYKQIMPEDETSDFFGLASVDAYNTPEADLAEKMYWQQVLIREEKKRNQSVN